MLNNSVVPIDNKQQVLATEYQKINFYYEKLCVLESFYAVFGKTVPIACYANFRDALFHYKKIYECNDLLNINGNMFTLSEHLHRSLKDAIVFYLNSLVDWIEYYCTSHRIRSDIGDYIKDNHSDITDLKNWKSSYLLSISGEIETKFSLSFVEAKTQLLRICVNIFQQDYCNVEYMRKFMHILKNYNHKIRSSSSVLVKPFSNSSDFEKLLEDINALLLFIKENKIESTFFLYTENMTEN